MDRWTIDQEQYQTLVSYLGCGDFENAKIVFFGIEEGTGGNGVRENVVARATTLGEYENGEIVSALRRGSKDEGFWEPDALAGERKIRDVAGLEPAGFFMGGFFNRTIARMSLHLEQPGPTPDYWFQAFGENEEAKEAILNRMKQLFQKGSGCKPDIALTDWRPLPRPNESVWPEEYEPISKRLYLRAFDNPGSAEESKDSFSNYTKDAEKRGTLLRNLLRTHSTPLVIGFGKIPVKRNLLEHIFPGLRFESFSSESFPNHPGLTGSAEGTVTRFLLLPFPDPTSRTWTASRGELSGGDFAHRYFREVTDTQIRPVLNDFM